MSDSSPPPPPTSLGPEVPLTSLITTVPTIVGGAQQSSGNDNNVTSGAPAETSAPPPRPDPVGFAAPPPLPSDLLNASRRSRAGSTSRPTPVGSTQVSARLPNASPMSGVAPASPWTSSPTSGARPEEAAPPAAAAAPVPGATQGIFETLTRFIKGKDQEDYGNAGAPGSITASEDKDAVNDEFRQQTGLRAEHKPRRESVTTPPRKRSSRETNSAHPLHNTRLTAHKLMLRRFREEEQPLLVLEVRADGSSEWSTLRRSELLEAAQEKAREMFGEDAKGAARARDIRILDPEIAGSTPTVLVRAMAMVVSLDPVRALVLSDRVLLLVPYGADLLIQLFKTKLMELTDASEYNANRQQQQQHQRQGGDRLPAPPRGSNLAARFDAEETDPPLMLNGSERNTSSAGSTVGAAIPFELRALEGILWTVATILKEDMRSFLPEVDDVRDEVLRDANAGALEKLRVARDRANAKLVQAQSVRDAMNDILEDDDTMARMRFSSGLDERHFLGSGVGVAASGAVAGLGQSMMNATAEEAVAAVKKASSRSSRSEEEHSTMTSTSFGLHGPSPAAVDVIQEIEMLFELYIQHVDSIIMEIEKCVFGLSTTESSLTITLDARRNKLLFVEVFIQAITAAAGMGAFVAGVFGMNLDSGIQEEAHYFWGVAGFLMAFCVVSVSIFMGCIIKAGFLIR